MNDSHDSESDPAEADGTLADLRPPIDLLWTGGWDSTFRLLDVVLHHHYPVQPWYVIDEERASTFYEIESMDEIRKLVVERDPEAAHCILRTNFVRASEVAPDADITRRHKTFALGSQYGWLARFAQQQGLTSLELGAIGDSGGRLNRLLRPNIEQVPGKVGTTYRLVANPENEAMELFRRFEFPIIDQSKRDMQAHAKRHGFLDLMRLTWFCHTPKGGKPCGMCTPCMVAIKCNMAWRIPPLRRVRPLLRIAKAAARKRWPPENAARHAP